MSIYATLWSLKFPRGDGDPSKTVWIEVVAQGVPAHIGTSAPGYGYEAGDPYAEFLPPAIEVRPGDEGQMMRAVVFVIAGSLKGTTRSGQEYVDPLLVLSGDDYSKITFDALHRRLCAALAARP